MRRKYDRLCFGALFLALGMVLPLLTSQIKEVGDSLLPMHSAVMLCGLVCGKGYGLVVGLVLPFLRSICFGMPPLYPNGVWMALELATYGFVTGFLYQRLPKNKLLSLYLSLVSAMVCGRVMWGLAKSILLGLGGKTFTFSMFIAGGLIDALPGIVLQLILIPVLVNFLEGKRVRHHE